MSNNTIDYSKSYNLSFGGGSETEAFQIKGGFSNSPMQFFLNHLSCKPEYPVLPGTVYRHNFDAWATEFELHPAPRYCRYNPGFSTGSGWYDIDILGVRVRNVVLFAHSSTRIKVGILNMRSNFPWSLHSQSGNKTIYSASQPKMLEFPTGIYQLDINGSRHQIEIKDALILDSETMEYSNSNIVEENDKWKITNPRDPPYANTNSGNNRYEHSVEEITDRLFLPMLLEATRVLEEGIVREAGDVDMGLILGIGSRRSGAASAGAGPIRSAAMWCWRRPPPPLGERFRAPASLREMATAQQGCLE